MEPAENFVAPELMSLSLNHAAFPVKIVIPSLGIYSHQTSINGTGLLSVRRFLGNIFLSALINLGIETESSTPG